MHGQRGHNCNVTFAVSAPISLVHYRVKFKTVTRESFEDFLAETDAECNELSPADDPIYLIYDNARPHVRAQLPDRAKPIIQKKLLPPYLPFLNMTEIAHSTFKADVKRTLAQPAWQRCVVSGTDRQLKTQGSTYSNGIMTSSEMLLSRTTDAITPGKFTQWYNHSQTYMPRCLARQQING